MAGVLFSNPLARQLSISGAILPGWTATFYLSETTTPADVYTDGDLQIPHENPVEAEADGHMPPIYLDPDVTYRVLIKDANGVLQPDGDIDPVDVSRGAGGGGGGGLPIAHCRVDGDGNLYPGSVGIASAERDAEGEYVVLFEDGYFSSPPTCVATLWENDESAREIQIRASDETGVTVITSSTGGAPDDGAFHLIAAGGAA